LKNIVISFSSGNVSISCIGKKGYVFSEKQNADSRREQRHANELTFESAP
jgi:hypothetical protein